MICKAYHDKDEDIVKLYVEWHGNEHIAGFIWTEWLDEQDGISEALEKNGFAYVRVGEV
jgi:hypothetical protein